jgi:hypothetical protein
VTPNADYGVVIRVDCGNCGEAFWCHDLGAVGYLALDLHGHWMESHNPQGNIHGPATTIYRRLPNGSSRARDE